MHVSFTVAFSDVVKYWPEDCISFAGHLAWRRKVSDLKRFCNRPISVLVSSLYESKEIGLASDQAQLTNKAIVDHTSPALCTPITPFPAAIPFAANALQYIVNGKETPTKLPLPLGTSPCRKKSKPRPWAKCTENLVKIASVVSEISPRTDRHKDRHRQTDVLITILRHRSRGRSNKKLSCRREIASCFCAIIGYITGSWLGGPNPWTHWLAYAPMRISFTYSIFKEYDFSVGICHLLLLIIFRTYLMGPSRSYRPAP